MPDRKTAQVATHGTDWTALGLMTEEDIERIAIEDADNLATEESHWIEAAVGLSIGKT